MVLAVASNLWSSVSERDVRRLQPYMMSWYVRLSVKMCFIVIRTSCVTHGNVCLGYNKTASESSTPYAESGDKYFMFFRDFGRKKPEFNFLFNFI